MRLYLSLLFAIMITLSHSTSNLTADLEVFDGKESVTILDNVDKGVVQIEIIGPSNQWVGVGFNGTDMNNTYAIVCGGEKTKCQENVLGVGNPGVTLPPSIKVVNDTIANGKRYVEIVRSTTNTDARYYSFPSVVGPLNVIAAIGATNAFNAQSNMAMAVPSSIHFIAQ